jgi:hypothetical protein
VSSYSGADRRWDRREKLPGCRNGIAYSYRKNSAVTCGVTVEKRTIGWEVGGVLVRRNAAKLQVKKSRDMSGSAVASRGSNVSTERDRVLGLSVGTTLEAFSAGCRVQSRTVEEARIGWRYRTDSPSIGRKKQSAQPWHNPRRRLDFSRYPN